MEGYKLIEADDGNKEGADDILPVNEERLAHYYDDDEPNPLTSHTLYQCIKQIKTGNSDM